VINNNYVNHNLRVSVCFNINEPSLFGLVNSVVRETMTRTMYEKIWDANLVHEPEAGSPLLFVDRHLMHEVTSPQAFEGLRLQNRKVRNVHSILGTIDHCVPTKDRFNIVDVIAKK